MNRKRIVIGILLMVLSVAALVFWETKGRNEILLEEVVVLTEDLAKDTLIEKTHLAKARVLKENRVEGSIDWQDHLKIIGKYTASDIGGKAQLSINYLKDENYVLENTQSLFVIPSNWIAMKSSSIRRGDKLEIFETEGLESLGIFQVAFVKDLSGIEVVDQDLKGRKDALNRWQSSGIIDHIEIISDLETYESIVRRVLEKGAGLLLVQREVF